MSFTSLEYFVFLPAVLFLYHLTKGKTGWAGMLLVSYGFYASAGASYLLVALAGVTVLTYGCGLLMGRAVSERGKGALLAGGVLANVAVLIGMKYLTFFAESLSYLAPLLPMLRGIPAPPLLVSVGVSFFVFQAIGYLVDIYLEVGEPEGHLGLFALSLAFFPKLLQGPIERCGDLVAQFREPYRFDYGSIRSGMILFLFGMFKKVVIADRLALFVDAAYGNPRAYSGVTLIFATFFYAFQIYLDFSGYTDMALGAARMFNIRLSANFNSPYLATSVGKFWRRWHMTFSRWILSYLFKPLQMRWRNWGNRGTALALLMTFLVSGLWHGAAWGFLVWGSLHGIYLACSVFWKPYQKKIYRRFSLEKSLVLQLWQVSTTFVLICFAWIFFRTATLENGWYVATHLLTLPKTPAVSLLDFVERNLLMGQSIWDFYCALFLLAGLALTCYLSRRAGAGDFAAAVGKLPTGLRWASYYALCFGIVFGGMFDNGTFIYFQF